MAAQPDPALTSVIIVSHNSGPALGCAIVSVLAQTAPVELVIVNNGNPPEDEAKLAAQAKNDPRIQLITGHGNVGLGKGSNLGARAARGARLLFLGAGCILQPDTVARMCDQAMPGKRPFMLGARLVDERGKDLSEARRPTLTPFYVFIQFLNLTSFFPKLRLNLHEESLPSAPAVVPAISDAFMFLATKDFRRVKGFNENYFSSIAGMDFCLRFERAEGVIYFVPGVVVKKTGTARYPAAILGEEAGVRDSIRYFHESFGHAYPQPVLWLLYALIWVRRGLWLAGKRKNSST